MYRQTSDGPCGIYPVLEKHFVILERDSQPSFGTTEALQAQWHRWCTGSTGTCAGQTPDGAVDQ